MLSDIELLNFIRKICTEKGYTGYDIGANTSMSSKAAYNILDGTTKNPRRKTLLKIFDYLEKAETGTKVEEGKSVYEILTSSIPPTEPTNEENIYEQYVKLLRVEKQLLNEIQRLKYLLEKNDISYE